MTRPSRIYLLLALALLFGAVAVSTGHGAEPAESTTQGAKQPTPDEYYLMAEKALQKPPSGDKELYLTYLKVAADGGHRQAAMQMALYYAMREEGGPDLARGLHYFETAGRQGDAESAYMAALMYREGDGVPVDLGKSAYWFRKGAEGGHGMSQFYLGEAYAKGLGVEQDEEMAAELWRMAAAKGVEPAKQALAGLGGPKLFGLSVASALRDQMRRALADAGVRAIREDNQYWADVYDANGILPEATQLSLFYVDRTSRLALVKYTFPSHLDSDQVHRVRRLVESKYGPPLRGAAPSVGPAWHEWEEPGVGVRVERGWPDTSTHLIYVVFGEHDELQAEIEKSNQAAEKAKFKKANDAF